MNYDDFLKLHEPQLTSSEVPELFWPTLYGKLKNEIFDVGESFSQLLVEGDSDDDDDSGTDDNTLMAIVKNAQGLKANDPKNIFLVDHAWTFELPYVRAQLTQMPQLLDRVADMMQVKTAGREKDLVISDVMDEMWRYIQTYQFSGPAEDGTAAEPIWYLVDEFGASIHHSDDPTVGMAPFYFMPTKTVYSIFWPLHDLEQEDEITRDFAPGIKDAALRQVKLYPWLSDDVSAVPWQQGEAPDQFFKDVCPNESLPSTELSADLSQLTLSDSKPVLSVYTDIEQVKRHLKHSGFQIVDDQANADIWWLQQYFKDYSTFSQTHSTKFINQFCNESILTIRCLLAMVSRRARDVTTNLTGAGNTHPTSALTTVPAWLPTTYDLTNELTLFASYYQIREERNLDNHWICKPWNTAQHTDYYITNSLDAVIRLSETAPKVVSKYISDPVLYRSPDLGQVKFNIRYILMLSSTQPLKLHVYQPFSVQFSNKSFSMDALDDRHKHCPQQSTDVMLHHQFIANFEQQNPTQQWNDIQSGIYGIFRELFSAACSRPHPYGIPISPQSRAIYAVDITLAWTELQAGERSIQPMVLDVSPCPDCEAICKQSQTFYDDIFSTLFLNDTQGRPIVDIA